MQRVKESLCSDDSAVSPVIGVILMVAITVILAAVIASFVLGLGDSTDDVQPNVQVSAEYEHFENETDEELDDFVIDASSPSPDGGNVTLIALEVNAADGDIDASNFRIEGADLDDDVNQWDDQADDLSAGESFYFMITDFNTLPGTHIDLDHIDDVEPQLDGTERDYIGNTVDLNQDIDWGDEFQLVYDSGDSSTVVDTFDIPEFEDL